MPCPQEIVWVDPMESPNAPINPLEAYNRANTTIPADLRDNPKAVVVPPPMFQYDLVEKGLPGPPLALCPMERLRGRVGRWGTRSGADSMSALTRNAH